MGCDKYGHIIGEWQVVDEATCTRIRSTIAYCVHCGGYLIEIIPKLKHTLTVSNQGYSVTCTTDRLTDEIFCSICSEIVSQQEVIVACHQYSDWEMKREATEEEDGVLVKIYSVCKDRIT